MTLSLQRVQVGYRAGAILQDISLDITPHQVVCLLGPNGCGKTTLLKTILGLIPPLGGRMLLDGVPLTSLGRTELARRIAYVPQAHHGMFPFTADQIVLMGRTAHLRWHASPGKADAAIAAQSMERLGIAHLRQRNYMQLSGGERQLVMIARALAQEASILIMDEPTSSLDFGNQVRVLAHIRQLRDAGFALLLTMHQPDQVLRVADCVVLLHQGRMLAAGPGADVMTAARLAQLYGLTEQSVMDHLPVRVSGP